MLVGPTHKPVRFARPSASLVLKRLLRARTGIVWVALAMALVLHGTLPLWRGAQRQALAAKPLTTKFVKRRPRLTKPLELKKRPRPRRRTLRRKMVAVRARADLQQRAGTFEPSQVLHGLAGPQVAIGRATSLVAGGAEEHVVAQTVEGTKETKDVVDMSLELLSIDALNTGKYHAMVIQDPEDKRNLQGFCRLSCLYIPRLHDRAIPHVGGRGTTWFNHYVGGCIRNLVDAMNEYTAIDTRIGRRVTIDDGGMFAMPWIFHLFFYHVYKLSDSELELLGRYLVQGGFMFADSDFLEESSVAASHRDNLLAALETQGMRKVFRVLPDSHPMYHCYFDFNMPPPGGDAWKERLSQYPSERTLYLEGLEVHSRLVSVLSKKGYYTTWCGDWPTVDVTRQLQFGVNLIVFALTQEGSITRQLMDSVNY